MSWDGLTFRQWIRRLWASKISITIVYPPSEGVKHSTTPQVVEDRVVTRVRKSNLRLVSEKKIDYEGKETLYYMTERWESGRWSHVSNSFTPDRNKAMELHLRLLSGDDLEPKSVKTVHWEGLSKDEAITWIELSKDAPT